MLYLFIRDLFSCLLFFVVLGFFLVLPYSIRVIQDMKRKKQFFVCGKHSINVYPSLLHFILNFSRAICLLIHLKLLLSGCLNTQWNRKICKHKNVEAFPALDI